MRSYPALDSLGILGGYTSIGSRFKFAARHNNFECVRQQLKNSCNKSVALDRAEVPNLDC